MYSVTLGIHKKESIALSKQEISVRVTFVFIIQWGIH